MNEIPIPGRGIPTIASGGPPEAPPFPANVTLSDVAQAAGVSLAAASRALNGKEGVRENVRARVQLVADSLGYRPNRAAKNLAGGRASVIGLLLCIDELQNNHYVISLLQAFAKAAEDHDEGLMLLTDSRSPSKVVENLIRDGLIDGVIISAIALEDRWVEELLDAKLATVIVGAHPRRSDVCAVDVKNREPAKLVVGHMLDTGCERVAMISGIAHRVDAARRLAGYRDALLERGLVLDESLIFSGNFTRGAGWELCDEIVGARVDGVFCANDQMALGLHDALQLRGLSAPEDISLAGFDGTSLDEFRGLDLTTVVQPFSVLADTAIVTLKSLVDRKGAPREQLVQPTVHWGSTTRRRSAE